MVTTSTVSASSSSSGHRRALPALVLGGAAIGCSPIFVRVSEVSAVSTAFWRLALALIPLLVLFSRAKASDTSTKIPRRLGEYVTVTLPGVFLAAELATWHISLHMTSVANSTLLVNMTPIFVTLFSWLVLRQKIGTTFLTGLALSIVGIVVLKGGPAAIGGGDFRGDAVALSAAALYAGYILLLGRAREIYATTTIMLWSTTSAALCTLALALVVDPTIVPWTLAGWVIVLGLAWISHAGGQSLITYALAWLPATFSSLTLLIQPVVAAILAWALLAEPLSTGQIIGGIVVIAGIFLARLG
ncbi:DMT family transporter [Bradyrhizobium tropiciagri]|nr:DMT family transporter [Bradyrhizobium tropiciagri]MBR0898916.1 DMT family transporter [Bradyrhizobium tropiciagri]